MANKMFKNQVAALKRNPDRVVTLIARAVALAAIALVAWFAVSLATQGIVENESPQVTGLADQVHLR